MARKDAKAIRIEQKPKERSLRGVMLTSSVAFMSLLFRVFGGHTRFVWFGRRRVAFGSVVHASSPVPCQQRLRGLE